MKNKVIKVYLAIFLVLLQLFYCTVLTCAYEAGETFSMSSTVNATVKNDNTDAYTVIIPQTLSLSELSFEDENIINYEIEIIFNNENTRSASSVRVQSQEFGYLTNKEDEAQTLNFTNSLTDITVYTSQRIVSEFIFEAQEVQNAKAGEYIGIVTFNFEYTQTESYPDDSELEQTTQSTQKETQNATTTQTTTEPTIESTTQVTTDNSTTAATSTQTSTTITSSTTTAATTTVATTTNPTTQVNTTTQNTTNASNNFSSETSDFSDGTYTANVSMMKYYSISEYSMCSALFYDSADITISGDTATLTLYLINPIPMYQNYGTPLLDIVFEYEGKQYSGTLDESLVYTKHFDYAAGFIDSAGEYSCNPITVTLPIEAIKNTTDGTLTCTAYVNVIMNSTQTFFVFLTDFNKTSGSSETPSVNNNVSNSESSTGNNETTNSNTNSNGSNNSETNQDALSSNTNSVVTLYAQSKALGYIIALTVLAVLSLGGYFAYVYYRRKK